MADGAHLKKAIDSVPGALEAVVEAGDLSGFVTLVWRKGEIVQLNAIGKRDIEAGLPMSEDTIFRIASMSKPVTSAAVLMLMEEGKLKLDDPITKWMPEFANLSLMKDAEGPVSDVGPAPRAFTIEDLLTHRAGLTYDFTATGPIAEAYRAKLGSPLASAYTPDQWLKALGELPLLYSPGERFHYSVATDVLGFLVARIEGKPFGDVLKERIFTPLGMKDTDFWVPPEKRGRAAQLYKMNPKTDRLERSAWATHDLPAAPQFHGGGGGLVSTAQDYLKFARMLLGDGAVEGVRLLKPETVRLMRQNRLTDHQRNIPFMGMPFWYGQGFGLGVSTIMDADKNAWMGAGAEGAFGWPGAFGTWWQADPKNELILIYLIQNEIDLSPEAMAQLAAGQRMGGRMALPMFQKSVYAALDQ